MNKIRYIAIITAGLFILSSCQKDDFQEAFDRADETVLHSESTLPDANSNEANANDDNPPRDVTDEDPVDIFVKEVSDGDDESDNDDNG